MSIRIGCKRIFSGGAGYFQHVPLRAIRGGVEKQDQKDKTLLILRKKYWCQLRQIICDYNRVVMGDLEWWKCGCCKREKYSGRNLFRMYPIRNVRLLIFL